MKPTRARAKPADYIGPLYQPYYCEENVWQLCQQTRGSPGARHAVFISNKLMSCPMWSQRKGKSRPVFWDYHVIMLSREPYTVWDLDTTLGFPVSAADYLRQSFPEGIPEPFLPRFRLVEAGVFVATFASDREHMRAPEGGFLKPPPPWPAIGAPFAPSNLMHFIDMEQAFLGEVLSLSELSARVSA